MGSYVKVAAVGDLKPGEGKLIEIGDKSIALFNIDGGYYAIDDTCPHNGASLSEGRLQGSQVTCSWHGSIFDLKTGAVLDGPATESVCCYPVRVVGSDVELEV
jgi:nitrite reductase/ring-hydroxylating ferredoxin subunit